ncbi:MAG TPA: polysaccharide biosynthesis C-terminal domain-containing protein [Candidatus Saccharimonadales bacterium]|nr:polysaccharide biosynthesis C-terminal domain-containing protein [Candidatus Saccharimonadales bacterium]
MASKKFNQLLSTGDSNFIEVIRHSFLAIILLGVGTIIQFVFDLSLTHKFKAHGSGIFYLCFSVLSVLALVGRLGMDRAVVRFIPPLLVKDPALAAGVNSTATRLSLLLTLPLTVLLFVFSPVVASHIFHSSEISPYLRIFSLAIPPLALNYVYSGVLRALKRTQEALSIERLTMYALGIIAVIALGSLYGLRGASAGFVAAVYVSTVEGLWYIRKYMPSHTKITPFNKKRLLTVSGPLLFVVFAAQMGGQASVLLLGVLSTSSNVGIFNIALRVSMLLNLILMAVNVIAATKVSELYFSGRRQELRTMIAKVSALSTLAGIPTFLILVIFSSFWLGLFGGSFTTGSSALIILAAGQLVNVSTGSNNFILAMTDHEKALAATVGISLLINVCLGVILIGPFDVVGAGIATAVSMVFSNLVMLILVKRYIGVWSLPFRYLDIWLRSLVNSRLR